MIQETGNLAVMILDRERVYSNPKKQLVVLFDGRDAKKRFESYGVTLEEMISSANDVFSIANLPIGYDLTSIKKEYIKLNSSLIQIDPFSEPQNKSFWKKEVGITMNRFGFTVMALNTVTLILTDKMILGQGFIYKWSSNGDGTIIMGVGFNYYFESRIGIEECGFMGCYPRSAQLTYLRALSGILAHEQGHLYGIYHSNYKNSIMYRYCEYQSEKYTVFDDSSVADLYRAVKKFVF